MGDIIENFGQNAGKVWNTLNKYGPQSQDKIIETTGLDENDFYVAVGWLAKENKIYLNDNVYLLGQTNLNRYIGEDAGKVWNVLNTCEEIDATYIPKLAKVTEKDAFCALGWLAREGKISAKKVIPKRPQMKFRLK
jgi:hypothetical protein